MAAGLVVAVFFANHAETRWLRSLRHGISVVRHTAGSGVARVLFVAGYTILLTIGLPGGPLMILGGAAFGPITGSIVNLTSIILGAAGGYWLARVLGDRLPRRVLTIETPHNLATLISLQINPLVPNSILNLGAGLAHVDFKTYMASVVIGNLAPTIAYSYFAGALLSAGSGLGGIGRELWIAAIVLAVILLMPIFAGRWRATM
ncbi:MAG TPA: VTT domain-containing protein [Gemmatimonadaceae bacterium]|nr:VTT domain-containing protein [Gemmatimonadaceae bacterium]